MIFDSTSKRMSSDCGPYGPVSVLIATTHRLFIITWTIFDGTTLWNEYYTPGECRAELEREQERWPAERALTWAQTNGNANYAGGNVCTHRQKFGYKYIFVCLKCSWVSQAKKKHTHTQTNTQIDMIRRTQRSAWSLSIASHANSVVCLW